MSIKEWNSILSEDYNYEFSPKDKDNIEKITNKLNEIEKCYEGNPSLRWSVPLERAEFSEWKDEWDWFIPLRISIIEKFYNENREYQDYRKIEFLLEYTTPNKFSCQINDHNDWFYTDIDFYLTNKKIDFKNLFKIICKIGKCSSDNAAENLFNSYIKGEKEIVKEKVRNLINTLKKYEFKD
jgi:hypothetical protein